MNESVSTDTIERGWKEWHVGDEWVVAVTQYSRPYISRSGDGRPSEEPTPKWNYEVSIRVVSEELFANEDAYGLEMRSSGDGVPNGEKRGYRVFVSKTDRSVIGIEPLPAIERTERLDVYILDGVPVLLMKPYGIPADMLPNRDRRSRGGTRTVSQAVKITSMPVQGGTRIERVITSMPTGKETDRVVQVWLDGEFFWDSYVLYKSGHIDLTARLKRLGRACDLSLTDY